MKLIAEEETRRKRPEIEKLRGRGYWSDNILNKNHSTAKHSLYLKNITMYYYNPKLNAKIKKRIAQLIKKKYNKTMGSIFLVEGYMSINNLALFILFFFDTRENVTHCLGAIIKAT